MIGKKMPCPRPYLGIRLPPTHRVRRYFGMSRIAEVIVLAPFADEVMEPLTRPDDSREWRGRFERLHTVDGWVIEFNHVHP